ncbi:MAG: transposase [Chloroflexi bacterium]|nr:transposase [Chloroflexota bacterium]
MTVFSIAADGSTLDALMRKVGLLRDSETNPLAGKIMGVLDLCSWLPHTIWYEADDKVSDQSFWNRIIDVVPEGALLILDLGFTNFKAFAKLVNVTFLTRAKSNLAFQIIKVHRASSGQVRDWLVWIGSDDSHQKVRLIQVRYQGKWYRYLTNELNPNVLPALYVANLYRQRWSIEDAFNIVKRLLGLAYFWTGSQHGILLQVWTTWMLYGVLVDLTDAVAAALGKPFMDISMEMIYHSLYYFSQAYQRGETSNVVAYLAANARWLGIIKRRRKRSETELLPLTHPSGP